MQITIEIDNEEFELEISIESYGYLKPANLTGNPDSWTPEEYEPLEFKIESAVHEDGPVKFTGAAWRDLPEEDKKYYNEIEMNRLRLKNSDYSDEEYSKILENIYVELER